MKKFEILDYKISQVVSGKKLAGLQYEHPLKDIFSFQQKLKGAHKVVLSDQFVNLEEGTGLVHTAPGHGAEDYKVGIENKLPVINPLGLDGKFDKECGKFSGVFAKDANIQIIQELKNRNLLAKEEKITHDYPMCWRCSNPLLMMAVPQWFFKVTEIREKLIDENKKINWQPQWAGQRFQNWLESLGDWPISRQRYWGIPLPIWICEKCSHTKVVGSKKELPKIPKDFHRPYIDEIILKCEKCKGKMKRVPDVLDVWFDAGVAPWASLGYPSNKKLFKKLWPVDFILEGPDQIRGWWNALMITGLLTFGRRPFNDVMFHGFVLDEHGVKMSKSKGNIISPEQIIEKFGRDILRFYFLQGAPWEDYYLKIDDLGDLNKDFMIIRNTFNFIKTYVTGKGSGKNLKVEDKWLLSKLNSLIDFCTENNLKYRPHLSSKAVYDFILNDLSRWYIKIVRDRVWPTYTGKDKQAAFFVLNTAADVLTRLLAVSVPFLAEENYQEIVKRFLGKKISVHLEDWPKADAKLIDPQLEKNMAIAKSIVEGCMEARQKAGIKLRWPISRVVVKPSEKQKVDVIYKGKPNTKVEDHTKYLQKNLASLETVIKDICNTKSFSISDEEPVGDFQKVEFEFGTVLIDSFMDESLLNEAMYRELIRKIQEMRKKGGFNVSESINLNLNSDEETNSILKKYVKELKKEVGAKEIKIGEVKVLKFAEKFSFGSKNIHVSFEKV